MSKESDKMTENLIAQGLNCLEVFEKTGNRTQFIAFQDQANSFADEFFFFRGIR